MSRLGIFGCYRASGKKERKEKKEKNEPLFDIQILISSIATQIYML